jgi:hypothetical protein
MASCLRVYFSLGCALILQVGQAISLSYGIILKLRRALLLTQFALRFIKIKILINLKLSIYE